MQVRVVGRDLPGLRCGEYEGVHVGVQHGREVVNLVAGDAERAVFNLTVEVCANGTDFRGPIRARPTR